MTAEDAPPRHAHQPLAVFLAILFVGAAAASNWTLQHVGQDNGPLAPRTIPIGWGLDAASGVLLVGVMISVRDALHEQVGLKGTLIAIVVGSIVSSALAPPALAVASGVTMLVAELADAVVYQRLRRRGRTLAAAASNLASSLLDSAVFLTIAYGVHAATQGTYPLTVGKLEASLLALAVLALTAKARPRTRLA